METFSVAGVTGYPPLKTVVADACHVIKSPAKKHCDVSTWNCTGPLLDATDSIWDEGQLVLPDCAVKVSCVGDAVRDGGGKTVKLTVKIRVLFVDITSTNPVYAPAVKPTGFIVMVNVAGVTVLLNEARSQGSPLVKRVKLSGAPSVVTDHCCAGGTVPPIW
jgi:hypothetical protein